MGCSMEKQEQAEAKKVYIEFNKAFVQARRNVMGDEFFSITIPKGTMVAGEDLGGWSFTQSKMYPSKYREGFLVASFPNDEWQVPLSRSHKEGNGEWKTEYRRVNASGIATACKEAKEAWAKEHGKKVPAKETVVPLNRVAPGARTLDEILELAYPRSNFDDSEVGYELMQTTRAENLANETLLIIWAEAAAANLVGLLPCVLNPEKPYDESAIVQDLVGGSDGRYSRLLVALLLDNLTEEQIVLAATLADSLDEVHKIREATIAVQSNRRFADAVERRYGNDPEPERAAKIASVVEKARKSVEPVTAATIGRWADITVPNEFVHDKAPREERMSPPIKGR